MRILIVGSFNYEMYETALCQALNVLEEEVYEFQWKSYRYKGQNQFFKFLDKYQERFLYGPQINKINKELIKKCEEIKPQLVFLYRGTHIKPFTIKAMKKRGAMIFSYNNDDPFSNVPSKFYWRHYLGASPYCTHNFVYRLKNINDFKKIDISNTSILRSYYIESRNFPMDCERDIDVVFAGHYEEDGRDEYVLALLEAGINVIVFGREEWEKSKYYDKIKHVVKGAQQGEKYNIALNRAKIAIVFLSKINSDTYTRRCFEIPAAKTLMISEYTEDLASMFIPEVEAVYFYSKEDLVSKCSDLLSNQEKRQAIAKAGHLRLHHDGHSITDRARQILTTYKEYQNRKQ